MTPLNKKILIGIGILAAVAINLLNAYVLVFGA